jgi:hypothetical protein
MTRLLASIMFVVMIAMVGYVVYVMRKGRDDGPRRAFDPLTTDPDELRRVTEAVSRVISAPPSQHDDAVQTLEAVRADSAGARDLEESCVNTYRSAIRAEQMLNELRGLLSTPDGGELRADQIPTESRLRAVELQRSMAEQIELAHESTDRCMDLYTAAVRSMGITPARRYQSQ